MKQRLTIIRVATLVGLIALNVINTMTDKICKEFDNERSMNE